MRQEGRRPQQATTTTAKNPGGGSRSPRWWYKRWWEKTLLLFAPAEEDYDGGPPAGGSAGSAGGAKWCTFADSPRKAATLASGLVARRNRFRVLFLFPSQGRGRRSLLAQIPTRLSSIDESAGLQAHLRQPQRIME